MTNKPSIVSHFIAEMILLLTMIFWASAFVGIRAGLQGYHPGSLALLRYGIASIFLVPIYYYLPNKSKILLQDIPLIALTGILGIGVYNIALNYAEIQTTAAVANFVIGQAPVVTALLLYIFLKEKLVTGTIVGIIISFIGVTLITIPKFHSLAALNGIILLIIATICSALYTVLQKPLLKKINPMQFACIAIWFATLSLLVYSKQTWHDFQLATISQTLSVIYLGIFPAAIAYLLWSYVLTKLSTMHCSSALYICPILTLILGWLLLSEIPKPLAIVGGLIALLGSYIVAKNSRKR